MPLIIDVVSDVVCPWCYLGKKRLEAALGREGEAEIRWRPFQLDPTIPPEGRDRKAYMKAKFGDGPRLAEIHDRLTGLGAEAGIRFDFAAIERSPNTLDAHRLIRFATEAGLADALVERLFGDYFERGCDIGDRAVLSEAARDCGLGDILGWLESGEGADEVREEIEAAQRIGVQGVPFFIFASKYAVSGAQSEEVLAQAIAQARAGLMRIVRGDFDDPRVRALLETHLRQCRAETAPGSAHALDVAGLAAADVEFFAGFEGEALIAVGALKRLGGAHGEVKSMHTLSERRGAGAGRAMLAHIVETARGHGMNRLSLETGAWDFFHPARRLYRRFGFRDTTPFAPYKPDPNSLFLTLDLGGAAPALETRAASEADLPAMLAIYNRIVATSTAIYRDDPTTLEERASWFAARRAAGFPVLVAERGGEVMGFATYGEFRGAFPGYRHTVEHSVHVGEGARGSGAGAALMGHLLDLAREAGVHVMVGAIDADNAGSLRFHDKLGFRACAHFHQVGAKFGRWLDLVFVEKIFGAGHAPG